MMGGASNPPPPMAALKPIISVEISLPAKILLVKLAQTHTHTHFPTHVVSPVPGCLPSVS